MPRVRLRVMFIDGCGGRNLALPYGPPSIDDASSYA